jgi:glutamine cyclotransferase
MHSSWEPRAARREGFFTRAGGPATSLRASKGPGSVLLGWVSRWAVMIIPVFLLSLGACRGNQPEKPGGDDRAVRLSLRIVGRWAHDPTAFTQGLVWAGDGFYESTGGYGGSDLRLVPLAADSALPELRRPLADRYFGEGLALVDDRLVQLTWRERTAFVYDRATLGQIAAFSYDTEGWGLCFDGADLIMSDGTDRLAARNPGDFAVRRSVRVSLDGHPVAGLNELECVGDRVYANRWRTTEILRIDPENGRVDAVIDARPLSAEVGLGTDVLNGIAHRPGASTLYLTGKRWHILYEVELLDASGRVVPP